MRGKVVTVFGGTGFVGGYLIPKLTEAGAMVRVVARDMDAALYLKSYGFVGQVELISAASITDAVQGADYVVNFIGILNESRKASFQKIHVDIPKAIAEACAKAQVKKLVHISAIGADPASNSAYAISKALGEAEVLQAFPSATIVRPSVIFGAEDNFINKFATMASQSPFLPLIAGGKTLLQPVFVGDVAAAICRILADEATHAGHTYELGGPAVYSFRELMSYILQQIQKRRCLVNIPYSLALLLGLFAGLLPSKPLTRDQVRLAVKDNVVSAQAYNLKDLGVNPTSIESVLPRYLARYRARS